MENPSINKPATYLIAGIAFLFVAVPLYNGFIWALYSLIGYPSRYSYARVNFFCADIDIWEKETGRKFNRQLFSWLHLAQFYAYIFIGYLLIKKRERKGVHKSLRTWLGLMLMITPLYEASWHVFRSVYYFFKDKNVFYSYYFSFPSAFRYLTFFSYIILPFIIAIVIHQKFFNQKEKIRLWAISFPAFLVTSYLWFWWLGKLILPPCS